MDAFLLKRYNTVFQEIRPVDFFVLLCAFLYGNLFVITFSGMSWGLLLISLIIIFFEVLNTLLYFSFFQKNKKKKRKKIKYLLCLFRRGSNKKRQILEFLSHPSSIPSKEGFF